MDLSKYGAQCVVPTCDVHQSEELDIYCHTCEKLICLDCIRKEHADHEYAKTSKIARQFSQDIPTVLQKKTKQNLSEHLGELDFLAKAKELAQTKLVSTVKRINSHRDKIHAIVDSLADVMIMINEKKANGKEQEIDNSIMEHKKTMQEIEELFVYLQTSSQSLSNCHLVQLKIELEKRLDQTPEKDPAYENELFYVEGKILKDNLESMVGYLIPNDTFKVVVNETATLVVGDAVILTVVPVALNSAWMNTKGSKTLELVDIHGSVTDMRELDRLPNGFDVNENGDIFYSSIGRKIMQIKETGSVTMFMDTLPLMPIGVSTTRNGDLLVTMAEERDYEPKDDSRRIAQRINTSGEVVTTYEFDIDGSTRLFTYPRRARQNYNGDICVVDITGNDTGRLCVLRFDGVMKVIYNGQNLKSKFLPQDVACDYTSNIIVNDMNNFAIHLLDPTGVLVKYLTKDLADFPRTLGLHTSGLWVGCSSGVIKIFNYDYEGYST